MPKQIDRIIGCNHSVAIEISITNNGIILRKQNMPKQIYRII